MRYLAGQEAEKFHALSRIHNFQLTFEIDQGDYPLEKEIALWLPSHMDYSRPRYSKREVDKAGMGLAKWWLMEEEEEKWSDDDLDHMFAVVGNWRDAHSYPLIVTRMTLSNRAKTVDHNPDVVQRLKRLPSILSKLERNPNMKLSQMQDIGGCRATMTNIQRVKRLVSLYKTASKENPDRGLKFAHENDYITNPKVSGYRGVHLIYKYRTPSETHQMYNGLRIELQIRSKLQHSWATAVETVDTFTRQSLKSSRGGEDWLRFFALMGSTIARREKSPLVPGTPETAEELKAELKHYTEALNVRDCLDGYGSALRILEEKRVPKVARYYVIVLDPILRQTSVRAYRAQDLEQASRDLLTIEQTMKTANAVLVSATSVAALQRAYPNYFWDTDIFVEALERAIA